VAGPPRPAKKVTQTGLGPGAAPGVTPEEDLLSDDDLVSDSLPPASDVMRAQEREPDPEPEEDPDAYLKLEEGKVLARKYRLVKPAGFGGMAQLWVAKNEATAAEVCVKVLVPEVSDEESVARFRREAHAAARLSHRAIVSVFDLFELDVHGNVAKPDKRPHALAIVMELLTGETLTDHLMKQGELHVDDMLDIAIPMCGALSHAHKAGVVHRDIKPDNVFLARDPDGTVIPKILDFGVSKIVSTGSSEGLTKTGVMLGTPSFMSPEQAKGSSRVDARSDVFSAGIVMMMMLTGKNPFEDEGGFHSIVQNIIEKSVQRPEGLSDAMWDVISRALMKDPDARWSDGTELQLALRKASGRRSLSEPGLAVAPVYSSDSKTSVPPVDTGEGSRPDFEATPMTGVDAERRARMIKIVAGIVMASLLIVGIALIRAALSSKDAKNEPRTVATSAPAEPPPAPVETTTAPVAATATAPKATATATATASATVTTTTTSSPTATVTVEKVVDKPKPAPGPAPAKKPEPKKDPTPIANTPGF
jgi:eukaryotic-like serine/threonine-protein kinase